MQNQEQNFEEMLKSLEEIVKNMEGQDMPLDEQIQNFSKGVNLVSACEKKLQAAETKVKVLTSKDTTPENDEITDFDPNDNSIN